MTWQWMSSLFPFGAGALSDNTCQANQQNMAWKYGGTDCYIISFEKRDLPVKTTWRREVSWPGSYWNTTRSETLPGHGWILEEILSVTTFHKHLTCRRFASATHNHYWNTPTKQARDTSRDETQQWQGLLSSHFLGTQLTLASYIPTKGKALIVLSTEHDDGWVEGEDRNLKQFSTTMKRSEEWITWTIFHQSLPVAERPIVGQWCSSTTFWMLLELQPSSLYVSLNPDWA